MFDDIIAVDWSSSASASSAKPKADAIYMARMSASGQVVTSYHRTRTDVMDALGDALENAVAQGARVLVGFDFGFGYPKGFAQALTGQKSALAVWDWLDAHIADGANNANNRFEVADTINRTLGSVGPFWGCPPARETDHLRQKGRERDPLSFPERRSVEALVKSAQPMWKLYTTGAVGGQALVGLPRLAQLRKRLGDAVQVWPMQTGFSVPTSPIVLAEIYPSLYNADMRTGDAGTIYDIRDARQVRATCEALAAADLPALFCTNAQQDAKEEGWILGVEAAAQTIAPPPLSNDCFALPRGVAWAPVDDALAALKGRMRPVKAARTVAVRDAVGRYLAYDVKAVQSNPPTANCAVDGYGFAFDALPHGDAVLDLVEGRAAAGGRFEGAVPRGKAIRILTGAVLPMGVDTVVLEEDCTVTPQQIAFRTGLKRGANCRKAGEDMQAGDTIADQGRCVTPADLARLSAAGIGTVQVYDKLRVAVISTGDELREAGSAGGGIFDANRPMLLALARAWGFETLDMGIVADDADALRVALDKASDADVILTSGGASAGDEDHVSRLLSQTGSMALWRVAMKPGRPLAMGVWNETPVFGLPGNPVAAFVCALIFARPAMQILAGGAGDTPDSFMVPAGFAKSKKAGRREYLRARMRGGQAEVYASEGSGRISGLSWAEGLVELPDEALEVSHGTPVKFIPFGSFGI